MRRVIRLALDLLQVPGTWPLPTISIFILIAHWDDWGTIAYALLGLIVSAQLAAVSCRIAGALNLHLLRGEFFATNLRLCRLRNDHPAVKRAFAHPRIGSWIAAKSWVVDGWKKRRRLRGDVDAVNIYVVHARIEDGRVPPAFKSFPVFDGPSYVFVHWHPDEGTLARFMLTHEIGHLGWPVVMRQMLLSRFPQWILVALLCLAATGATWETGAVAVAAALFWLSPVTGAAFFSEELWADKVGLWGVSSSDGHPAVATRMLGFMERNSNSAARLRSLPRLQFSDVPEIRAFLTAVWQRRLVRLIDFVLNLHFALRRSHQTALNALRVKHVRNVAANGADIGTNPGSYFDIVLARLLLGSAIVIWAVRTKDADLHTVTPIFMLLTTAGLLGVVSYFALGFALGLMDWINEYMHSIPDCSETDWQTQPRRSPYH